VVGVGNEKGKWGIRWRSESVGNRFEKQIKLTAGC